MQPHIYNKHEKIKDKRCVSCSSHGQNPESLKKHMKRDHINSEKSFSCKHCKYRAPSQNNLRSHSKRVHEIERVNIQSHIDNVHEKIKDVRCVFCNFHGQNPQSLKKHMKKDHFPLNNQEERKNRRFIKQSRYRKRAKQKEK